MKIYDISMKIEKNMPVYKGKPEKKPIFKLDSSFSSGSVYETRLEMNMHTGTHIDRPLHLIEGGSSMETLPLEKVVTKCKVFDLTEVNEKITAKNLETKPISEGDFIIFKTKNSFLEILENEFVFLEQTGAQYLCGKKIKGVGIDALGIERAQPGHETHKLLLGSDIVILEGLRLQGIEEGEYLLVAAPINIDGAEAAPVRALLIQ